mmetsp:Transcript_7146/g.11835  ORF Transcript_7146/g.11835 Transcript_7146/m.11835 type:complete len:85 (-) Transcript_7146:380-634(-)|eukprot:CAMPEP_0171497794 /NCGR_PEP_ID=MMETSP0958-20121227/7475_1 /TAXON_ID=87120 /ORGANISM="Aurantiochytrium limacinum, Strain ATCCMYA-1381" /LENGTH=84 /DNA_ID=CAMNT_0012032087 /DNA_START=516 /DNA_END=770 /DNA_ORIENTATION=-
MATARAAAAAAARARAAHEEEQAIKQLEVQLDLTRDAIPPETACAEITKYVNEQAKKDFLMRTTDEPSPWLNEEASSKQCCLIQ